MTSDQGSTPTAGAAFAAILASWGADRVTGTAYLTTGASFTSDGWELGVDGLLSFGGAAGFLHVINPAAIVMVHAGGVDDCDDRSR